MAGTTEPEILESGLSKLVAFLAQMRVLVTSETRNSELEQQVRELTEEELETTRATLREPQAATLEAQSAVGAINSLACA
uniref:Uncharacterized protein n=1 Tax=Arundo donax TaxID=35708 RepID=A0A0A9BWJ3_ARUDO